MSKKNIILSVSISVLMLAYSFALIYVGMNIQSNRHEQTGQAATLNRYIVKEYNNMIAVFEEGSDVPYKMLDIDISTIRKQDRAKFQEGIILNSLDELIQLEEDFCS